MVNFYNREDLKPKEVLHLIRLWECKAGESFTDYCGFHMSTDKAFLIFLKEQYPILYTYCEECLGKDEYLSGSIQYMVDCCEEFCTEWIPEDRVYLWNDQYELAIYPLAEFILIDDLAWQTFVEFFTDLDNTCSNEPWIDCYDIRKDFDEWRII